MSAPPAPPAPGHRPRSRTGSAVGHSSPKNTGNRKPRQLRGFRRAWTASILPVVLVAAVVLVDALLAPAIVLGPIPIFVPVVPVAVVATVVPAIVAVITSVVAAVVAPIAAVPVAVVAPVPVVDDYFANCGTAVPAGVPAV